MLFTLAAYRKMIFAKLRRLAPAKLDRQESGSLLKMIGEDIEALEVFLPIRLDQFVRES